MPQAAGGWLETPAHHLLSQRGHGLTATGTKKGDRNHP